ncbi:MAG: histidine phosphatase family protein, partial [Bacteroidota bacterium]
YDQLSAHGYEQARSLGRYLAAQEKKLDYVYVGPLQRHLQTYDMVCEAYAQQGIALPTAVVMPELDEHRWPTILRQIAPRLYESLPEIQPWISPEDADPVTKKRNHLKLFHYCMDLWAMGKLAHLHPPEYPTWQTFRATVARGLEQIKTQHATERGITVALFTSGGTISAAMGHVLGMQKEELVAGLNGLVVNTSITEMLLDRARISLRSFNHVPHLEQEAVTYV